jgi:hypothetical protein
MNLIFKKNISLTLNKVKAHSGNFNNELVDHMAKSAHSNNTLYPLVFLPRFQQIIHFPCWKGQYIEMNLRKFITSISRNRGFEEFINLYRNRKYKDFSISWEATFYGISDEEDQSETSFYASNKKAHRLKLMLNELPTIEHLKKKRPDLYDLWNCPMCKDQPETWDHVFSCQNHVALIRTMIFNHKKRLLSLINQFSFCVITSSELDHYSIWLYYVDDILFTFVDIIKGFVPLFLYDTIFSFVKSKKIVLSIISIFMNNIYIDFMNNIWKPRCNQQLLIEEHLGIDKKEKKKSCPVRFPRTNIVRPFNVRNIELEGVNNSIMLGGDWLQYYSYLV